MQGAVRKEGAELVMEDSELFKWRSLSIIICVGFYCTYQPLSRHN